jgi:RNase adapter protein RapZ
MIVTNVTEFVIIAGLSGAGRSTAADALEDLGWFVIDNLPPTLISKVTELIQQPGTTTSRVVLVTGTGAFFEELAPAIAELRNSNARVRVLFLDAADDALVRRFEGTRRRHPLQEGGIAEAIASEREMLTAVKADADVVVDTSDLNVHQLRNRVVELFALDENATPMRTSIMSFGYKYGLPLDVDLALDCRFLPNPHWEPELRPMTGLDAPVREYVMHQRDTQPFLQRLNALLELVLPAYVAEGKSYLTIAIGCTGGRHRSVVIAEEVGKAIANHGFSPSVTHRDIDK